VSPSEWQPFPVEALPEPVQSFVTAGAKALGTGVAYLAASILVVLAAAIGNAATIRLKRGWTEPAVLWLGLVGESGTLKSPTLDLALRPVRRRQAAALAQFDKDMEGYAQDKAVYDADIRAWQYKGRAKGEPPPEKPAEPVCQRFHCCDITVEAIAKRLAAAPKGLLLATDELAGWLGSFDRYTNGKGDVEHWLTMHGARDLMVDRKTEGQRPIYAPRAAVSIIGGIQPGVLRRALGVEHVQNGLAARLLVTMPPTTVKRWTDATVDEGLERQIENLLGTLYALPMLIDEHGSPKPTELPLSADAKRVWVAFYNEHAKALAEAVGYEAALLSKMEGAAARLALVIHLARYAADDPAMSDPNMIDGASITAGVTLARWFAHEGQRVCAIVQAGDEATERRELVEWIKRQGGRVTARDLQRGPQQFREDAGAAEAALAGLVRRHRGRWESAIPGPGGGRPGRMFVLTSNGDGDTTSKNTEVSGVVSQDIDWDVLNAELAAVEEEEIR
jgi:hypothetical protein